MLRNHRLVLISASLFFALTLILSACGGGGGGGGTPVTGTKPVAIYSDNAVVVGTTATVSGMVNPNGAGTYRFVLTDSLGGRQEKLPQSIGGSILQPVQAVFSGLNPVATNTVTVEATNTYGTANDFGIFPTWSTPPAITGSAVINVTQTSGEVIVTVNPGLDTTMTEVFVRFGTDPTMNAYSEMSLPVPAGIDNLVYAITGYADNTLVYYWLATGHTWGYWVSQTTQSFRTLPTPTGNGTITILVRNGDSAVIFRNNVEVHNFYNNTGGSTGTTYIGPAGSANKYRFLTILGTHIAATRPISITDAGDNNVFQLNAGGQLDVQGPLSGVVNGRAKYSITGSGWTSYRQAPANVNGVWRSHWVVDESTNNNVPVGATQDVTETWSQTEFLVTKYDSGLGTIYGTVNGDLVYWWFWGGSDPIWLKTWRETHVINSTGTTFTGDGLETWLARSGGAYYYVHWNTTATR